MKTIRNQILLLLILVTGQVWGQSHLLTMLRDDFTNTVQVGMDLGKQLVKPSREEIGLALGIGTLLLADESVNQFFEHHQSALYTRIFGIDRIYGEKNVMIPAGLLIYGAGLMTNRPQIRIVGLKSLQAMFYSGLLIVGIKELVGRARPYQNRGGFRFKPFSFQERWRSFPSGHAGLTFAFSTIIASAWSNTWWKGFWYTSAFLVAGARMYHQAHWLSDVTTGGLIGWAVARFVWRFQSGFSQSRMCQISPFFNLNGITGIRLTVKIK